MPPGTKKFSFSLSKKTAYENLSEDYKKKLFAKCLLIDRAEKYEDFVLALEANGYKYKNFVAAYRKWYDLKQENDVIHSLPDKETPIGMCKEVIANGKGYAIDPKTLKFIEGRVKVHQHEEKPNMAKPATTTIDLSKTYRSIS